MKYFVLFNKWQSARAGRMIRHSHEHRLQGSIEQQRAFSFSRGAGGDGSENHQNSSSSNRRPFPNRIRSENPYEILGIQKNATYDEARRRFVELALRHHPDTSVSSTDDDKDKSMKDFIRFRQAFEALREGKDGMIYTRGEEDESSLWSSDEEFNAWFYEETGHADIMFCMDIKTRKEVIDVVNNQAQGGLDRGGMWEMARKMAEQEEMLKHQKRRFKNATVGLESSSSSSRTDSNAVQQRRK
jgi:DnaJ-class molecular chaperone